MTKSMLNALKEMWMNPNNEGYVHMSTADALESRKLIFVGGSPKGSITESGNFPQWLATLTEKGEAFCREQFGEET